MAYMFQLAATAAKRMVPEIRDNLNHLHITANEDLTEDGTLHTRHYERQGPQSQSSLRKATSPCIKRRQTQYFRLNSIPEEMPPKPPPKTTSPRTDIGIFLQKLGKPMSEIQQILTEYPNYEEKILGQEKAQARQKELVEALEAKEAQIKELEAAVAVFEGVHMNSSKVLKKENSKLSERISETEGRLAEAEERSKASRQVFVREFEKLIKDKNHELEQTHQDHAASLEKQKSQFEKQQSEIIEKGLAQLNKVSKEMQQQSAELEKLDLINDGLKKKLAQSNRKLKEIQQELFNVPDDIFEKEWKDLAKDFHSFCKTRFTSLPQGSTVEQVALQQQDIKEKLLRAGFTDKIPFFIPTGNIEASKLIRLAGVEHIISESICKNIFQFVVLHNCPSATGIFETISEQLYRESPWKEAIWRTSTVSILAGHSNVELNIRQMVKDIFELTNPLIREDDREIVKTELAGLFRRAFEIWLPAQKNSSRIFATTKFTENSPQAWESHPEQDEFFGSSEDELAEIDSQRKILCLFPRVYREKSFMTDKGVDPEDEGYTYFPGTALYADAGAYIVGQREHREFQKLMEELSKKAQVVSADPARMSSRRNRRPSVSKAQLSLLPPHPQTFGERIKKSQVSHSDTSSLEVVLRPTEKSSSAVLKISPK